jgi:hypothetical protein
MPPYSHLIAVITDDTNQGDNKKVSDDDFDLAATTETGSENAYENEILADEESNV